MKIRNIIKEVIKEYYDTNKRKELKKFLIDSINFDDYGESIPDREKINNLFKHFLNEVSHDIDKMGMEKALIHYLQGLPTFLNIPYTYYEIKNLLYSLGYDEVRDMDKKDYSDLYYNELVDIILEEAMMRQSLY